LIALGLLGSVLVGCAAEPRLLRESYHSEATGAERDYFVYLPAGHASRRDWPVLLFLHGNGERGDGRTELDYVLTHGPLYEAWVQKRDLPFVIIAPLNPIVGYPHPDLMPSIAVRQLPVWCFAGGRDPVVPVAYFYPGLNELERLGHPDVRFTVEEDMGHDVWTRVYAGEDLYDWLLAQRRRGERRTR